MNTNRGFINIILAVLAILVVGALSILIFKGNISTNNNGNVNPPVACTMEAKLCPDGSYVARSGPNCDFTACPNTTPLPSKGNSGVKGTVMLGPTCPVERNPPDPNCADKPYKTTVAIFRASDPSNPFVLTQSDANGNFSATLPPGDYTLGAGESNLPRCDHPAFTVSPSSYTFANISCDTGIR